MSAFLSYMSNPLALGFIALCIVSLILLAYIIHLHMKMRRFLVDIDAHNIADSLMSVTSDLKELQDFRTELESYLSHVEQRLRTSLRSVHTIRFNPFHGTGGGGNQSFATTILNEEGDGVIISSLYSRDHVSVFGKPVKKHSSEYELSEEESDSLKQATKGLK